MSLELNLGKPLCFIDLETTGINVGTDRIVEICILKIKTDQTREILTKRVNPTIHIPNEASAVHGIFDKDVANEPTFKDIASSIAAFLGNSDLAGYNSSRFDIPLLAEEFLRVGIDFDVKNRRLIDVQTIFHKMEARTLSAAMKFYCGKTLDNAHSAEADTIATYEILKAQLERYQNIEYVDKQGNASKPIQNDMNMLCEFSTQNKAADLSGHIIFDDKGKEIFSFGKHKGRNVEDVFRAEPSYYDWIMKSDFPLYTKKILTGIYLRQKQF